LVALIDACAETESKSPVGKGLLSAGAVTRAGRSAGLSLLSSASSTIKRSASLTSSDRPSAGSVNQSNSALSFCRVRCDAGIVFIRMLLQLRPIAKLHLPNWPIRWQNIREHVERASFEPGTAVL